MQDSLYFRIQGELYVVKLSSVMYFKADDHYTHVYYASGTHFMMPFLLSRVETAITESGVGGDRFLRLGRTYIIDTARVFHVNIIKKVVLLCDDSGGTHTISVPKHVLQELSDRLGCNGEE